MLGYQEGQIGDKPEEWFDRIHDADRETSQRGDCRPSKGLTPHFESEHRVLHKDEKLSLDVEPRVAVHDASGKVLRMAGSQARH